MEELTYLEIESKILNLILEFNRKGKIESKREEFSRYLNNLKVFNVSISNEYLRQRLKEKFGSSKTEKQISDIINHFIANNEIPLRQELKHYSRKIKYTPYGEEINHITDSHLKEKTFKFF